MSLLHLDYQQELPQRRMGVALLALMLAALAMTAVYYIELNDMADSWGEHLAQAEHRSGRTAAARQSAGNTADEVAQEVNRANEVLRQLSLPWDELFRAVETAAGKDMALLAMEPDTEKRQVKISGEAKDFAALLDYITQLEAQPVFGAVRLQSYQVQQQDSERPVRFALRAVWRGQP
ncbi:MAG TPA: PilN domain-containing protein [Sideroxyarcus sp.]|nr:PilN domain-containing protein [Sideroxyarcus sp.]